MMKLTHLLVTLAASLFLVSCTNVSGVVELSTQMLITNRGQFNYNMNFLGTLVRVQPFSKDILSGNRLKTFELAASEKKESTSVTDHASLTGSNAVSAKISVSPTNTTLEAEAKTSLESSVTLVLEDAHRLELLSPEDFVRARFDELKSLLIKYKNSELWIATSTTEGKSISLETLQNIGSSLKAAHPEIGTFSVDYSSASKASFSRITSTIGQTAPIFISYQKLVYDQVADRILLSAIPPEEAVKLAEIQAMM